jgi:RNA polymerase sigma-70 factor (ECF subfamily)
MQAVIIDANFATAPRRPRGTQSLASMPRFAVAGLQADRDRRLLAAVAGRHDRTAFLSLYNHFAPRLKGYMKKLGTPESLAEELAQDVMFAVWRKAETYDPAKSAVSSWIFTIARNLRIDALRREQRRILDANEPSLTPTPAPLPDEQLQSRQQVRRMRTLLDNLPREQAAVVSLAFYEGKSHGEIAAQLAIPLGTVKSRMRLAFQHLRDALDAVAAPDEQAMFALREAA